MIFPWILLESSEDFSFPFWSQAFKAQIEEANAQDKADAEAMVQNHQPGEGMKSYPVIREYNKGQCKDPYINQPGWLMEYHWWVLIIAQVMFSSIPRHPVIPAEVFTVFGW